MATFNNKMGQVATIKRNQTEESKWYLEWSNNRLKFVNQLALWCFLMSIELNTKRDFLVRIF